MYVLIQVYLCHLHDHHVPDLGGSDDLYDARMPPDGLEGLKLILQTLEHEGVAELIVPLLLV